MKQRNRRRVISLLLALCMVVGLLPAGFAAWRAENVNP